MPEMDFMPGDLVIYRDRDCIPWGPWQVVNVLNGHATVQVEGRVTCAVKAALLEKACRTNPPAQSQ